MDIVHRNATRRMQRHVMQFSPPVEVVTPIEESIEYYRNRLAELQAENDDLNAKIARANEILLPKIQKKKHLDFALIKAKVEKEELEKAIAKQKSLNYQTKRAIANRRR